MAGGGLWLCRTLVPSGLRAVVVPSGFKVMVQPHVWMQVMTKSRLLRPGYAQVRGIVPRPALAPTSVPGHAPMLVVAPTLLPSNLKIGQELMEFDSKRVLVEGASQKMVQIFSPA